MPDAVEVNGKAWSADPTVRAFFSNVGDLQRIYSSSQEVRDYFDNNLGQQSCYALLSTLCTQRTVLGMEMHGDVMRRDVRQTSVSFGDHRVVKPASSEVALRKELENRAFEVLVSYALECITKLVSSRYSLQEQRQLLDMQLKLAHVKSAGLAPLLGAEGGEVIDIEALRKQYQQKGEALEEVRASLMTLDDYIERIAEVLGEPQAHLKVDSFSMRLSKMNIRLDDAASAQAGHEMQLTEVSLGESLRRVLLITRFPRDELLAKQDFLT
jgi:predicted HicB family RNase H-like nuclease